MMHAVYIQRRQCSIGEALEALEKSVEDELRCREQRDSESRIG